MSRSSLSGVELERVKLAFELEQLERVELELKPVQLQKAELERRRGAVGAALRWQLAAFTLDADVVRCGARRSSRSQRARQSRRRKPSTRAKARA